LQHYDTHERETETETFLDEVVSKFGERELSLEELNFDQEAPQVIRGSVNPIVPMETDTVIDRFYFARTPCLPLTDFVCRSKQTKRRHRGCFNTFKTATIVLKGA